MPVRNAYPRLNYAYTYAVVLVSSSFWFLFKSNETLIEQFVEFKWIDQGHVIYRNEGFIK